jgi:hypothetical protein
MPSSSLRNNGEKAGQSEPRPGRRVVVHRLRIEREFAHDLRRIVQVLAERIEILGVLRDDAQSHSTQLVFVGSPRRQGSVL